MTCIQRTHRLSTALSTPFCIDTVVISTESGPYANEVAKACKWAAITCVVVTVPVCWVCRWVLQVYPHAYGCTQVHTHNITHTTTHTLHHQVLGKVAQVSFERTLGTIIGRLLQWFVHIMSLYITSHVVVHYISCRCTLHIMVLCTRIRTACVCFTIHTLHHP